MEITKVGTVKRMSDGTTEISGFAFDAEGGPLDLNEMARLAVQWRHMGWHRIEGEPVYVYRAGTRDEKLS